MEAAISSIEVEVSSAAWAWPCAPCMMRRALAEIWPAEEATCTEASWMLSTTAPQVRHHLVEAAAEGPDLVVALRVDLDQQVALGHGLGGQGHVLQRAQPAPGERPAPRGAEGHEDEGHEEGLEEPPPLHRPDRRTG